jgi:hypothetical protein
VRVFRQFGGQAVRRGELSARQLTGVDPAEQVRPSVERYSSDPPVNTAGARPPAWSTYDR